MYAPERMSYKTTPPSDIIICSASGDSTTDRTFIHLKDNVIEYIHATIWYIKKYIPSPME